LRERWDAASRTSSARSDPGAGSSWLPRLTRPRYRTLRATFSSCPDEVAVAIDVHGSEDQAKDASTAVRERGFYDFLTNGACTSKSTCGRNVPFLSYLWTSAVAGAAPRWEETHSRLEPNRAEACVLTATREGYRLPANRDAFHRSEPRGLLTRDSSLARLHAPIPRSRRPHVFPKLGKGAFTGIASTTVQSPAIRGVRETDAFFTGESTFRSFVPGN